MARCGRAAARGAMRVTPPRRGGATLFLLHARRVREVDLAALEDVPPLASLGLDIDGELSAIVARGLSADPDDRHASARDMEIAFRRWLGIGLTDEDDEHTPDAVVLR